MLELNQKKRETEKYLETKFKENEENVGMKLKEKIRVMKYFGMKLEI